MAKANKKQTNQDISQEIMAQIHAGHIKMRPKLYFLVGSILLGIGLAGVVLLSILFFAITTFHFRTGLPHEYLYFGRLGIKPFINTIPWFPIIITTLSLVAGIKLTQRFDFSYQKRYLSILIGAVTAIVIIGIVVDRLASQHTNRLPPLKPLYKQRFMDADHLVGQVVATESGQIIHFPQWKVF